MWRIFRNKQNFLKRTKMVPNFLDSLDGLEIASKKVRKKIDSEVSRNIKSIQKKKKVVLKSYNNLEKIVLKKVYRQHNLFNKVLIKKEEEIKKIRLNLLKSGKVSKIDKNKAKFAWQDSLVSFFIVLLVLIFLFKLVTYSSVLNISSFKDSVVTKSKSALNNLMGAQKAVSDLDLLSAEQHFTKAGSDFLKASEEMSLINDEILTLASLFKDPNVKLAAESKKFLKIGLLGSELGAALSQSLGGLAQNDGNWLQIVDDFKSHGVIAVSKAEELNLELAKVNSNNLPVEYRASFEDISKKVNHLLQNLKLVVSNTSEIKTFLGSGKDKRYLLVFQNNSEMRGSGGFLGSYALVDFREGKIRNLEVPGGGSYDTEAGLKERVKAPAPLWLVNPLWHFWDANWWPDWPTTAKNLMWFYEKSDGPTVDGVISFTPNVIEKLLTVTGPIDLTKDHGLIISADNFWQEVQLTAERDNVIINNPDLVAHLPEGTENQPKKIIGDLTVKILEVLPSKLDKDNLIKLLAIFEDSLSSKQVMFYFQDEALQKTVLERNWGGQMIDSPFDYLMVVNTNIAGAKTDRVIRETIKLESEIMSDGSVLNKLKIIREHTGERSQPLTGVRNVNWLRVYVPAGSELILASGFSVPDKKYFEEPDPTWKDNEFIAKTEGLAKTYLNATTKIYQENGKTVFADWTMVDPGNTVTIDLVYKLPFNVLNKEEKNDFASRLNSWLNPKTNVFYPYSILFQKQPGSKETKVKSSLTLPDNLKLLWSSNEKTNLENSFYLNQDSFYSVLLSNDN